MNIYILSILFSCGFMLVVLDLVRRRKLKEQYSLLWLGVGAAFVTISLSKGAMERLADAVGIQYAPAMLFFFGLLFCFGLILHLTVVASRLTDRVVRLTQEISLLKAGSQTREKDVSH